MKKNSTVTLRQKRLVVNLRFAVSCFFHEKKIGVSVPFRSFQAAEKWVKDALEMDRLHCAEGYTYVIEDQLFIVNKHIYSM